MAGNRLLRLAPVFGAAVVAIYLIGYGQMRFVAVPTVFLPGEDDAEFLNIVTEIVAGPIALAEAFNATLKRELLHGPGKRRWSDEAEARTDTFRWIARYNHRRRHSAIGNLPPTVYEDRLARLTALAA